MTMTDAKAIEVMARAMCRDDSAQMGEPDGCDACDGKTKEPCYFHGEATKAYQALTDAGYVIMTKSERDAIRAAALREAAAEAKGRNKKWKMPHPDDAKLGEVCDDISACRDIAEAILALATERGVCAD